MIDMYRRKYICAIFLKIENVFSGLLNTTFFVLREFKGNHGTLIWILEKSDPRFEQI